MTDLVVISLERWDGVWRRNQHLIAGCLRNDPGLRVLFVEPRCDPLHGLLTRADTAPGTGLRSVELEGAPGRLWAFEPTKWLPRRVDHGQDARWARKIARTARRLGFNQPVLWINDPAGAEILRLTGWPALYDITDDWLEAERTPAEHARLVHEEALLMERCAEVVVCSPTLAAARTPLRQVTLIPNGVDVDLYRTPQPRPSDLPTGPVALYLGTIHTDRLDLGLCVATARSLHGAATLVLVGPHPLPPPDLQRLRDAGVLLLGAKPAGEVPGYLQHADVLVVPHVVTPFTLSLDPIKRYEYAAVGRPVVSTPVTGFVDATDARVTVASGDAFVTAVAQAVTRPTAGLSGAGTEHVSSWSERASDMQRVINRVRLTWT